MGLAIKSKRLVQSLYTYYSDKSLSVKVVSMGGEETVDLVVDDDANCTSADDLEKSRMEEKDDDITEKVGYNRFMLDAVWSTGWERLERDNVREK